MITRTDLEQREERDQRTCAMQSRLSRGRRYPEPEHPYRAPYQRDRDRIVHCAAFRRLEYKTQVFVNHAGDYYRTRLTHTMEVVQIARSISRALGLNEDLTECLALCHDLGHTLLPHRRRHGLQGRRGIGQMLCSARKLSAYMDPDECHRRSQCTCGYGNGGVCRDDSGDTDL